MISWVFIALSAILLVWAAISDVRTLRIPNWISVALFSCYPAAAMAAGTSPSEIGQALAVAAAVLAFGFALFSFNFFGGGDAKLLAAASPWFGLAYLAKFMLAVVLAGGVLCAVVLVLRNAPLPNALATAPFTARLRDKNAGVPYGVAIATGAILTFPYTPLFASVLR